MILCEIKKYLIENKCVAISDLAYRFDTCPDAIRGMLEVWIKKGDVTNLKCKTASCNQCGKCCKQADLEIYKWNN